MKRAMSGLLMPIALLLLISCVDAQQPPEKNLPVCLQGEPFITSGWGNWCCSCVDENGYHTLCSYSLKVNPASIF